MPNRFTFAALGAVLATMGILYFSGPRIEIDTTLHPVRLPKDLDRYLLDSEARLQDIVPGTEKTIVWAGDRGRATAVSVVYLHGFSATRQETAPLADNVASGLNANLFYARLTGHGRNGEAMGEASVNAWLNDANEALTIGRRLGGAVVVIGVSTGGTLAAWMAVNADVREVAAFILISPNFSPVNPMATVLTWPWGGRLAELLLGKERSWKPENERHGRYWTTRYPTKALLPMMGLVQLTRSLDMGAFQNPVLVIYSPKDQVVDPGSTESVFKAIGSPAKRLHVFERSADPRQHVLAGDILSPRTTRELADMTVAYVKSVRQTTGR